MANATDGTGGRREDDKRLPVKRIWLVLGIIAAIIGVILLAWLALTYWSNRTQLRYRPAQSIAENVQVQLLYPSTMLLDQPHELTLSFTSSQTLTSPLDVILFLPPGIRATGPLDDKGRIETMVRFEEGQKIGQQGIAITNAGTAQGLILIPQTLTMTSSLGHQFEVAPTLSVEGARAGAARLTITGALERNTPLLLAIVGLGAFGALLIDLYYRERTEDRAARRTADEKRVQEQERSEKLVKACEAFSRFLREGDLASAERTYGQIDGLKSETGADTGLDYALFERLLRCAQGEFVSDPDLREQLQGDLAKTAYVAELAGALMLAAPQDHNALQNFSDEARYFYLQLSPERIRDAGQRHDYRVTLHQLFKNKLQSKQLDIHCPEKPPEHTPMTHFCPAERAESEEGLLNKNGKDAFWSGHPDYSPILERAGGTVVVRSAAGGGRSALARHTLRHFTDVEWFAVLVVGNTAPSIVRRQMALSLLRYVGQKATLLLSLYDEALRQQIAGLLVEELGKSEVDTYLAGIINDQAWMSEAEGKPEQQERWPKIGRWELELMRQAVAQVDSQPRNDLAWFRSFGWWASVMKFTGVHLVLDSDGRGLTPDRPHDEFAHWQEAGLAVTLFIPDTSFLNRLDWSYVSKDFTLTWDETQLRNMLTHRSERLISRTDGLTRYFSKDAYDVFLAAKPTTPRQIGRVWRQLLASRPVAGESIRFSVPEVRGAIDALSSSSGGAS